MASTPGVVYGLLMEEPLPAGVLIMEALTTSEISRCAQASAMLKAGRRPPAGPREERLLWSTLRHGRR